MTTLRKIEIAYEYGEVGFGSSKREDYLYEISYYRFDGLDYNRVDRTYHADLNEYTKRIIQEFLVNDKLSHELEEI